MRENDVSDRVRQGQMTENYDISQNTFLNKTLTGRQYFQNDIWKKISVHRRYLNKELNLQNNVHISR